MKTEHLAKAYESTEFLLKDLSAAQKQNPADADMIFSLVQDALKLSARIGAILSAASQANAARMKGTK